jgi:putative methionine-R-sulfoxide reductase with GAF domain
LKVYRSSRQILADIEQVLDSKPSHRSPLEKVVELLSRGRHYSWVGIYLILSANFTQQLAGGGDPHPAQLARPETRSKVLVSIRLAGHDVGILDAESDRENAFGADDRVLLENVTGMLARFLTGPGKYLARRARQSPI